MKSQSVKRFFLLIIILGLIGCDRLTSQSPIQEVKWSDHNGTSVKDVSQLGVGVTWRALIWDNDLYYLGTLGETNSSTIFYVNPDKGLGRVFSPIPQNLDRFTTLALVPGPDGHVGWFYKTSDERVVGAVFGPDGWMVEPQEIWAKEEDLQGFSEALGATWTEGRLEAVFFRGYQHRPFDSKGVLEASLELEQSKFEARERAWPEVLNQGNALPRSRLLGASYENASWQYLFAAKEKDRIVLWHPDTDKEPLRIENSSQADLTKALHHTTEMAAASCLGFSAGLYKKINDPLFVFTPPASFSEFEMALPEGATAWKGLYRATGVNQLAFVPCYYDGRGIFQKVGGRFLTLAREGAATMLLDSTETPKKLGESLDFPGGSNDFVFLGSGTNLTALEFGGRFLKFDLNAATDK